MRFCIIIFLVNIGLCFSATEDPKHVEIVKKAIQFATNEYEKALHNATVNGEQSSKYRGTRSTPETDEIGKISHIQKAAFDILTQEHKLDSRTALRHIRQALPQACQQSNIRNCPTGEKFRSQDGTCNNLRNPLWGSGPSPFTRVLPAQYEDGVDAPRGGRQRSRLPNPRTISNMVHPDSNNNHPYITNMVPQFGQFLDHDITSTAQTARQCCGGQTDPDCWAIPVPLRNNEPLTCVDFTRSTPWCFATTGVREQINVNTAFIDGSHIYGSSDQRVRLLRTRTGGRLVTDAIGRLPTSLAIGIQLQGPAAAGDDRVNETPALTVLHNVFIMEHNRIASELQSLAPSWDDERLFQETRRIVGAELQQITYSEYLPVLMGNAAMQEYDLALGNSYSSYNPNVDPSIFNSFATAAYRFGHSLVNGLVRLISDTNALMGTYRIRDNFFQNSQITQNNGQGYEWILRGLMTQNSQQCDPFFAEDLTTFLFKLPNATFGSDLVARNIQRGRDHGLPGYNAFRNACGLRPITSWGQSPPEIRPDAWARVQYAYGTLMGLSPDDIDLFTGGVIENAVYGGITGPTFNCLKGVQFARLKAGDRFFFTHGGTAGSFTTSQLSELRRRTLGDIICQNSKQPSTTRNVFLVPSASNPFMDCSDTRRSGLNLRQFIQ